MSHQISIVENGKAEIVCGRGITPWHSLGTVVQGLMTASDALNLAHLNWSVETKPVWVNGVQLPFPSDESASDCWQAVCRSDNGNCLGILKGRYEPIQNSEAFKFFDHLIGQGEAVYDTAGALRGGRQVWLLAKIDGAMNINGDEHRQYALMLTSHDGSYALQVSYVLERVVCANTLAIALRGESNTYKIRHLANWINKESEAATVLGLGQHYFKSVQAALTGLNQKPLSVIQMERFTDVLIPSSEKDNDKVPTRTLNIRSEINRLFGTGDGNKGESRWDALQAVTDYVDHESTIRGSGSTRLESGLFGSGGRLKQAAFNRLTDDEFMGRIESGNLDTVSVN